MKALLALLVAVLGVAAYFTLREGTAAPIETGTKEEDVAQHADELAPENADADNEAREVVQDEVTSEPPVTRKLIVTAEAPTGFQVEFGIGVSELGWRAPPPRERVHLAQATSVSPGRVTAELAIPESWYEREQVVVWGRPIGDGQQQRYAGKRLPRDADTLELRLQFRDGATVRGRVELPDGSPVGGAAIQMLGSADEEGSYDRGGDAVSDVDGSFELHTYPGGPYDLVARKEGAGTARKLGVAIDWIDPPEPIVLTLAGPGEFSGRVVDPAGEPIRHFSIWACPADVPDQWVGYFHDPQQWPFELEGKGLYDDKVLTDEDGAFHFRGLRQGKYIVRGKTGATGYYERVLTTTPVETGSHDLVLTLERYTLVLRIEDHVGGRLQPALQHDAERSEERHALFCLKSDTHGRISERRQYPGVDRARTDGGDILFEVEPGQSYAFGVVSEREPLHEEFVTIASGEWQTLRTIRLGEAEARGTLNVVLETPDGKPVTETNQVIVLGPVTGVSVRETSDYHDEPSFETPLAAGTYTVLVDAEPSRGHHGERFHAKQYTQVETTADVRPGARTDLIVPLGEGGNLELTLALAGLPDDSLWPSAGGGESWDNEERDAKRGARVTLTPLPEGTPIAPDFGIPIKGMRLGGPIEGNWVAPNTTETSPTLLVVGEYLLHLQAKGYAPHEERITIEHGKTTKVSAVLKAE